MRVTNLMVSSGLCLVIASTGCKEEVRPPEQGAAPTPAPAGAPPAAAGDAIDPCTLLTDADIEEVLGQKVPVVPGPAEPIEKWSPGCLWKNDAWLVEVHASTEAQLGAALQTTAEARYGYSKSIRPPGDEIVDISGMGDAAFWSKLVGLTILKRDKALVTLFLSGTSISDRRKPAEALGARIAARL